MVRLAFVTIGSLPAAEDVVQDVFAELYRRYDQIEVPVATVGWWLARRRAWSRSAQLSI